MAPVAQKTVNEDEILGLPKWVWAAIAGGVVTAGVLYYIFAGDDDKKKKVKKDKKKGTSSSAKVTPNTSAKPTPSKSTKVVIEDVPEDDNLDKITDPLEKALAAKNKGNKYFKGGRYELAIKCYSQAIEVCPEAKKSDLSTFYQNRAAAYEQLDNDTSVISDCSMALKYNPKYVKAMERRARVTKKMCEKRQKESDDLSLEEREEIVKKLKLALEDCTAVCILEGFQKQEPMILVDAILKDLGRAEAKLAAKKRVPVFSSTNFIRQYFQSFASDPILNHETTQINGDSSENGDSETVVSRLKELVVKEKYEEIVDECSKILESTENKHDQDLAKLLRGTFYILKKQHQEAMDDFKDIIEDSDCDVKIKANALIKRASLYIQQCKDPAEDPLKAMADFKKAEEMDPENADIFHHRGQVNLLTEQIDAATKDFEKAVTLNPNFPIAYVQKLYTDYRQAMQRNDQTSVNNVINLFEKAKGKFADCVESYALYAQVLSDQNNFEKADELYDEAIKVDPENANLLVHRGLITLQWKGDIVKAVELITQALDVDDKCEFAYETLGTVEVQRGNLTKAIQLFEKAIPLANTELEMAHLFGLRDAAVAQTTVSGRLGITMPGMMA